MASDKSKKTTYVATNGLMHKIGSTDRTIEQRNREFRTGNPDIEMLASCPKEKVSETELHHIFDNYRKNKQTEWFCLPEAAKDLLFKLLGEGLTKKERELIDFSIQSGKREVDEYWEFYIGSSIAPLEYTSKVAVDYMSYVFKFGPHKDKKITSMNSDEELLYCQGIADIKLPDDANRLKICWPEFKFRVDGIGPVIPLKAILSCKWWLLLKIRENRVMERFINKRYQDFDFNMPSQNKLSAIFGHGGGAVEAKIRKVQNTLQQSSFEL